MLRALLVTFCLLAGAFAINNGVALLPPMGWNTWYQSYCDVSEELMITTIDALKKFGLDKYGYNYVNLDDCWALKDGRDSSGRMMGDPVRFKSGIKKLADYAHSKGLKLGIYSDVGYKTCQNFPGSYDHYEIDAQTFADWGIDFLKLDFCNTNPDIEATPWVYYEKMSVALNKTGRPMVYSICNWGVKQPWEWAPAMSNMWRTTGDSQVLFERILQILDDQRLLYPFAGESQWNDPDMLLAGVNNTDSHGKPAYLTIEQSRAQYSIWCILSAPLLLSNDLRKLGQPENRWLLDMITNEEVIAVNQDVLKVQGRFIGNYTSGATDKNGYCTSTSCTRTEIWSKPITNNKNTFAAVLFNRAGHLDDKKFHQERISISFTDLNVTSGTKLMVRDLWKKKNIGVFTDKFVSDFIAPQDVIMISLMPVAV